MSVTEVSVSDLERCTRVQVRAAMNAATVDRYAEDMGDGAVFDPVVLFRERATERFVIADGHHRVDGARKAGKRTILAEIREGDETAALEYALGANANHGLQRSQKDIENGVRLLLENPALCERYPTDTDKAELLRVSLRTLQRYKVRWREDPDGAPEVQEVKHVARQRAESHTPRKNGHAQREHDTCHVQTNKTEPTWTHADRHGYELLRSAWRNSTQAARDRFLSEVA